MPAWYLAAFKAIPWTKVVAAAPGLVKSAQQLVKAVRNDQSKGLPPAPKSADMDARLGAIESRIAEIAGEAMDSAKIVESLTTQNAELVKAVEILRAQTHRLAIAVVVVFLITLALALTMVK